MSGGWGRGVLDFVVRDTQNYHLFLRRSLLNNFLLTGPAHLLHRPRALAALLEVFINLLEVKIPYLSEWVRSVIISC